MKRLTILAVCSFLLYGMVFGFILDRPLSLGLLQLEMQQKTARLARLPARKLVILAGSNGPYSHSCQVIGAMLSLACENAGIAVGIGLDDIFMQYASYLHKGDIVYMPMETAQYVTTRAQNRSDADGGILLRYDRARLMQLPPDRSIGALFCCNLSDFLESLAEMPIAQAGLIKPQALLATEYNEEGDRIGAVLASADKSLLNRPARPAPDAKAITAGYGAQLIAAFVASETARGVIVIGGLPTDFTDAALPPQTIQAISDIYTKNGGRFMVLANHSHYPREDFYDSEDHLAQPYQYIHSVAVANMLKQAVLFVKKKNQKNFAMLGHGT